MAESSLALSLAAVQASLPKIPKNKKAVYGKYADLDSIHEAVLPLLSKNGLAWTTLIETNSEGNDILTYKLIHGSTGEALTGSLHLRLTQNNMQQLGSAVTYARRYAICAVVGITADEDEDGNTASGRQSDGTGSTKAALPRKTYTKPAEASIDINADMKPVTDATRLSMARSLESKVGKDNVKDVITKLAQSAVNVTNFAQMTEAEGLELLKVINTTDQKALMRLTEGT